MLPGTQGEEIPNMMFTTKVPIEIGGAFVITYKDRRKEREKKMEQSLGNALLEAGDMR